MTTGFLVWVNGKGRTSLLVEGIKSFRFYKWDLRCQGKMVMPSKKAGWHALLLEGQHVDCLSAGEMRDQQKELLERNKKRMDVLVEEPWTSNFLRLSGGSCHRRQRQWDLGVSQGAHFYSLSPFHPSCNSNFWGGLGTGTKVEGTGTTGIVLGESCVRR